MRNGTWYTVMVNTWTDSNGVPLTFILNYVPFGSALDSASVSLDHVGRLLGPLAAHFKAI